MWSKCHGYCGRPGDNAKFALKEGRRYLRPVEKHNLLLLQVVGIGRLYGSCAAGKKEMTDATPSIAVDRIAAQRNPYRCGVASLLQQFALGRCQRLLARFQIATDNRQGRALRRILKLTKAEKIALFRLYDNVDKFRRNHPRPVVDDGCVG